MKNFLSEENRHGFCLKAIELKKEIESRFVDLGGFLYEIRERRHYEAGWSSWEEYTMELKMSTSMISRLIRIYETFVLKYQFAPEQIASAGGWTTVAVLLPEIKENTPKNDVSIWLEEMVGLTREHAKQAIIERKGGIQIAECEHKETYTLKICKSCGEKWKIWADLVF